MADARTVFSLTVRDEASGQLKKFTGNYEQTLKRLTSAGADNGPDFAQLAANVGSLEGNLTLLGATAPQVALAMTALGMASTAVDWARQAADVEAVHATYARLAAGVGVASDVLIEAMRMVSSGMISDTDLMLGANTALALGVADNAQEITGLLQVAIAKGAELGIAPTKAFADLINGLGRMSPEILNNIAVVVDAEAAYAAYAAQVGTTAKELSEAQKMQALVNAVFAANPDAAAQAAAAGDSAAAAFRQWDVATQQFSITMGTMFLPAMATGLQAVTAFLNAIRSTSYETLQIELDKARGDVARLEQLQEDLSDLPFSSGGGFFAEGAPEGQAPVMPAPDTSQLDAAKARVAELEARLAELKEATDLASAGLNAAGGAAGSAGPALGSAGAAADGLKGKLAALAGQADSTAGSLRSAWIGAIGALGASQAFAGYEQAQRGLEGVRNMMNIVRIEGEKREFIEQGYLNENNALIQQQVKLVDDAMQKQSAYGAAVGATASAYDGLTSKVQGLLQQSLSLDVDWPGKDGQGGGGDAINENAKRLAAVANEGLIGQPWLEEFASEAPGTYADLMLKIASGMNPQAAAQQLMGEFQAGLRPDLLDQGMIKERVKAMILGENSLAQTAQEIAAEVAAELGVSMPEALAAANQALGVSDDGGGQDQFGAGFADGVDGPAVASSSLAKIAKAFLDHESQVRQSGGVVGAWWGGGFMATVGVNVPPGLLDMLTAKLLPAILAAQAGQASMSGTSDGGAGGG